MRIAAILLATILWAIFGLNGTAVAGPDDYKFEPLSAEVKMGADVVIAARLVHKRTGKPVPDAVIFARRADMSPDGMATMTAELEPAAASDGGVYQFKSRLPMAGKWQISLAAKIQGETGTHQSKFGLRVTE